MNKFQEVTLKAKLAEAIQKWVEANVDDQDWPDMMLGEKTVACMTEAAFAVLEATAEGQEYAEANRLE